MRYAATILIIALLASVASAQTFGLGDDEEVSTVSVNDSDTFGLGDYRAASAEAAGTTARAPDRSRVVVSKPVPRPIVLSSTPYSSPPGYHRHVLVDGSIIEHHDSNYGDPVAHSGVAGRNWPKYYGPLPPGAVRSSYSTSIPNPVYQSCPGGVCPTSAPARRGLFFRR